MVHKLIDFPDLFLKRRFHGFDEGFDHLVTGDRWTTIVADGGTIAVGDGVGGKAVMTTQAADNDELYLHTTNEIFLFAADKAIVVEGELSYTESNTDDANVMFGLMDGVAANALVDNGAGPKASYSGAVFYKVDGGVVWNTESSLGGSQVTTDLTAANKNNLSGVVQTPGGGIVQTLRIEVQPLTSTLADVNFFIGVLNTGSLVHVANHQLTYTSATEMQLVYGVKAGSASSEVVTVERAHAWQVS